MAKVPKDIRAALKKAVPRPKGKAAQGTKRKYAERLSNELAVLIANCFRKDFPGVLPDAEGKKLEPLAASSTGVKRADVRYITPLLGLALGVSIKTNNFRDQTSKRYTKNLKRVDEELLAEAMAYHVRQPFSVLVALYFMPVDGCDDSKKSGPSSFGSVVKKFRRRAGRADPDGRPELFEALLIGLYDPDSGEVGFFNVEDDPPRAGRPTKDALMTLPQMVAFVKEIYFQRNDPPFKWGPAAPG